MSKEILRTKLCKISQLDEKTFHLWDLSGRRPTPYYYKTLNSAMAKAYKIFNSAK